MRRPLAIACFLLIANAVTTSNAAAPVVWLDESEKLQYAIDARGNKVPDFSHAGYRGGGHPLPSPPATITLAPIPGDDGVRIQAAIDHVAALPVNDHGIRGVVALTSGSFEVAGALTISHSGVILRGSGNSAAGTTLVAIGHGRRTLIAVTGQPRPTIPAESWIPIAANYVPVGTNRLNVPSNSGFSSGDTVLIKRPSTQEWIDHLGMGSVDDRPSPIWKPGQLDILWERTLSAIREETVEFDVPLTCSLDRKFGEASMAVQTWPGRISNVGIENLRLVSESNSPNPLNEEHAWIGISIRNAQDCWVSDVVASGFVTSAVNLLESTRRITVQDCQSIAPISELAGYRRHSFYSAGQQSLFLRCRAEQGRHDFALGWAAPGPNAFVYCEASRAHDFSGPIESWVTGALYDNLVMDGGGLRFDHREIWDNGVAWTAANCMAWQCTAPLIVTKTPPDADNWMIGCWAQFSGTGTWRNANEFVDPDSLYEAQLEERLGKSARQALAKRKYQLPSESKPLPNLKQHAPPLSPTRRNESDQRLSLTNGWITLSGQLLTGNQPPMTWWRGHAAPRRASEFGIHLTRFTPGREGYGLTDPLSDLAERLVLQNGAALRHHWGLWYDRRRDDHQMTRRMDADVWPPFYEQPWARSGIGTAWDGLSRYDLTRFNPWYFDRLEQFANHCEEQGLVLINAMYFQHNILEAGAHWADFPWRSANNINETGFPEPPPYVRKKRIFMAKAFYDIGHPTRRALHRRYIRQCLSKLADRPNVLHILGEEFSGPTSFVRFWLEVIQEWETDTGKAAKVILSAPKNVQDAILDSQHLTDIVDGIDFKYWWRSRKGLYAPDGDQDLAPRQHERLWKGGRPTDETLASMAVEYRTRFPDKVILCDFEKAGWAFLCAGGSLPNLPRAMDADLRTAIPTMVHERENASKRTWALRSPSSGILVYLGTSESSLEHTKDDDEFSVVQVLHSGQLQDSQQRLLKGRPLTALPDTDLPQVLWLRPKTENDRHAH